jgi:hypothetical protein
VSVEEHIWIRCDYPTCDARTPDHVDRVLARRWAADHGWAHQHPSADRCPTHAGKKPVVGSQPPQPPNPLPGPDEGYWSPEARAARLERDLDRIMR